MLAQFKRHRLLTRKTLSRCLLWAAAFFLVLIIVIFGQLLTRYKLTPSVLWNVMWGKTTGIAQANGRTNIVLLGIGGASHEGGDLTDTIMVASIDLSTHDILLISLPRDIWIPTLKDRINSAYHFGEAKSTGSGMILAKSAVEEVVGLPIHYGVLIDFDGFQKMIDAVGGIDVSISETFTDTEYPITGRETDECGGDPVFACRYETITFTQGVEHMNGERALKYVRSRHAQGDVGTDFSRGKRQQAVLMGLKNKLMKMEIVSNFEITKSFIQVTQQAIEMDMNVGEALLVGRSFVGVSPQIRTTVLTQDEPKKNKIGLLINPPLWQFAGKWVLIPKHEDFTQIGKYVSCVIENKSSCDELMK